MKTATAHALELVPQIEFVCAQHPKAFVYWSAHIKSDQPQGIRTQRYGVRGTATGNTAGEFYVLGCEQPGIPAELFLGCYTVSPGLVLRLAEDIEEHFRQQEKAA